MEKRINFWLIGVLLPIFVLTCAIRFEVEYSALKFARLPYQEEFFLFISLVVAAICAIRSVRRWSALIYVRSMRAHEMTEFTSQLSEDGRVWAALFHIIEMVFSFLLGTFFIWALPAASILGMVLIVVGVEQLIFLLAGLRNYGIVMTRKVIAVSGRALDIIELPQLRSIEMLHDDIHFINIKGKTKKLGLEKIPKERRIEFAERVKQVVEDQDTYVSSDLERKAHEKS